ncbi:MAG: thioredoxin family protein [Thermonema sp.]|uniref:bacillithiol system redox-active protein YtxJ n=1 Tax=Thermonema sp. TaxID=2231181 RepID=UPI0021DC6DB9|nr:bacillithiol system redox-active protein YtxJ [Thermonema sp.]GIV38916.1 MAG: thioredoxin family protein [Thermonema sp.]
MGFFEKIFGSESANKEGLTRPAWQQFPNEEALVHAIEQTSFEKPVLIFKHSTRCSISATALNRLERTWNETFQQALHPYLVRVIEERPLSNAIARLSGVEHQSPQLLIFKDGKCVYHSSHLAIDVENIKPYL